MVAVLISTHGPTAQSLIVSAEMICGKQTLCEAVPFLMGQSLDDFQQQIENHLASFAQQGEAILCLVDLKGGTPFNTSAQLMASYPNLEIITGVNIPMLLATFMLREQLQLDDLLPEVIKASVEGIEQINIASMTTNSDQDEDF